MLILVAATGLAQIKGNGTIETKIFPLENVKQIKINLYANVTIDAKANEELTIATDENLFDLIDKEVVNGVLYLNQKKWISPSKKPIITIGAPYLYRVEQGTHDTTKIINVDNEELRVIAPVGKVFIEGKTKELRLGSELSTIDASKIKAEKAFINLWSRGTVTVNATEHVWAKVSNSGKLILVNEPKSRNIKTDKNDYNTEIASETALPRFIKFKIRNNSLNRHNFFVVGPKPNGTKFGYGFPLMPRALRKENWTTGTKVYKVNKLGFRKLLVTISADDENKIVDLF
ncbi:Putative auto-transporter adhesin, head GIN domain [Hyunsoonleella jejuensis]|uniref:Putative auto-transporter adhesin, head GIN domain n=2 Tax=Hyunsoonleella jejuensis TaxID=419940 RepID=A0A1H9G2D7_9FLAO|nr:Putative auto-transporter adhesin, head GIN domain [Hyunsoonleella jejuensis]